MSQQNDEINIAGAFAFIGRFFNWVYKGITALISFAFKYRILLFTFIILGITGGGIHYKFSKPVYHSDLIFSSNYLDNNFCDELIQNLQMYIDDETHQILADKLEIPVETAKKIKKIYFSNFNKKVAEKYENSDTIAVGLPFRLNFIVDDYSIFDTLKPVILNFFEKNPIVHEERTIRQTNSKLIVSKIEKQLIELDSLKKVVSNHLVPRGNPVGFVFGQPLDPLNIYREVINLYKEELDKNTDLVRSTRCLRLLRDFEVREKPFRPKLLISLPVGGLIGFLVGMAVAFILSKRNRLVE